MGNISIMSWNCPNCKETLSGICDENGYTRLICHRCGTFMVMKKVSRRKHVLEMTAPHGQVSIYR